MDIVKILKGYKEKKARVDTVLERIKTWEMLLINPDIEFYGYNIYSREIGMPTARSTTSQVEREAFKNEEFEDVTKEMIQEWVKEDKSRIVYIQLEVECVDRAIKSLAKSDRFIIELKHFENTYWCDIEVAYNKEFATKNYVPTESLKNFHRRALDKLQVMTDEHFNRFTRKGVSK